jgi:hypothetical protein
VWHANANELLALLLAVWLPPQQPLPSLPTNSCKKEKHHSQLKSKKKWIKINYLPNHHHAIMKWNTIAIQRKITYTHTFNSFRQKKSVKCGNQEGESEGKIILCVVNYEKITRKFN